MKECLDCNKELKGQHNPIRCKSCSKKSLLNPMYTDGSRTTPKNCIDCNKVISPNRQRCVSCHWKRVNGGKNNPMYGKRGSLSPAYKGKNNHFKKLIRNIFESRQWRSDVFTRDNYTCQNCFKRGGKLNAHHLKAFSKIIEDNNIISLKDAMNCSELWNINNGVTLCIECHKLTDNYLKKWKESICLIIENGLAM